MFEDAPSSTRSDSSFDLLCHPDVGVVRARRQQSITWASNLDHAQGIRKNRSNESGQSS